MLFMGFYPQFVAPACSMFTELTNCIDPVSELALEMLSVVDIKILIKGLL